MIIRQMEHRFSIGVVIHERLSVYFSETQTVGNPCLNRIFICGMNHIRVNKQNKKCTKSVILTNSFDKRDVKK